MAKRRSDLSGGIRGSPALPNSADAQFGSTTTTLWSVCDDHLNITYLGLNNSKNDAAALALAVLSHRDVLGSG